jgi:hypothetical protein
VVVQIALAGIPVVAWLAVYGFMLLATRPRGVTAAPAHPDLGAEPPAVVSLIANGWDLDEEAAEATLLDLGARGVIELRQPANDPRQTTIHIVQSSPSGLPPHERLVFDRIADVAVGGVVPIGALTFRDPAKAKAWWKRLRADIIADARDRGLSRPRFTPLHRKLLAVAAVVPGVGVGLALAHANATSGDDSRPEFAAGVVTWLVLAGIGGRDVGERDTENGRSVAGRWLGLRAWLRAHTEFTELPPSAVAVWHRYPAYGAALGTARAATAVIDLGMGNRRRVWSSFGGTWHLVRVRYPRLWPRYGRTATNLTMRAVLALAVGVALILWWRGLLAELSPSVAGDDDIGERVRRVADVISLVGFLLGFVLAGYGLYALTRVIIDAVAPLRLTGEVLWVEVWRSTRGSENSAAKPWLAYLAVDDGRADRTTAWGLPYEDVFRCDTGDTVKLLVRRWSRRVDEITVVDKAAVLGP